MNEVPRSRIIASSRRAICLLSLLLLPSIALAQDDVLLILAVENPEENDMTYVNILDGLGLTYQIVTHASYTLDDAADKKLVLISESVSSGNIANTFNDLPVPVVTMEGFIQDDMQFTGATENTHFGFVANVGTAVNVVSDHPVLGGLPMGLVQIYQNAGSMQWGDPVESAIVLATLPDNPDQAVLYLLEEGATLLDGSTTPARRAFFTPHSTASQAMSEQGTVLIANLVIWALGREDFVPIEAGITASFTATPSSGYAPLTVEFDASASSSGTEIVSYEWLFYDESTAAGVTTSFVFPDPGSFTVVLTVADESGLTASITRTIDVGEPVSLDPLFTIPYTPGVPVIDGEIDEIWAAGVVVDILNVVNGVAPVDAADLSATAKVMYDVDNLYVLYEVTDDSLVNDSQSSWQDDAVDLYLDGDLAKCFNCYDDNDAQFELSYLGDAITGVSAGTSLAENVAYAWADAEGGYRIEVSVPWVNFDVDPVEGKVVGIEFMVNDDDVSGDNRETKLAWFSDQDNTYQYAHLMGNAALGPAAVAAEEAAGLPERFRIASVYPNPFNPSTTVQIDAPTSGSYEVTAYNVLGAEVLRTSARVDVPGRTHVALDLSQMASGVYLISVRQLSTGDVSTRAVTLVR